MAKQTDEATSTEATVKEADQQDGKNKEAAQVPEQSQQVEAPQGTSSQSPLRRFMAGYGRRKRWAIPLSILAVVALLHIIPTTRYAILGNFVEKEFSVLVLDETTQKPVTNAVVRLAGEEVITDNKGQATSKVKVGNRNIEVTKKYYRTANAKVLVKLHKQGDRYKVVLKATGRQVPIVVVNKISKKPLADVTVKAAGSEVRTDKEGKAMIVLPADKKAVDAEITAKNFNKIAGTIKVAEQDVPENNFQLTPGGKIYFLSKLSGKIDVVKTNLDGTGRKTVLVGTGNEDQHGTALLASRDWKYLALMSRRDGGEQAKVFLIDTSNNKTTVIDEGNASFNFIGWADHHIVYSVHRIGVKDWEPRRQALKSYDAKAGKMIVLDQTDAGGTGQYDYAHTNYAGTFILGDDIVYGLYWTANMWSFDHLAGQSNKIMKIKADGTSRKTIHSIGIQRRPYQSYQYSYLILRQKDPKTLYIKNPDIHGNMKHEYFVYSNGRLDTKADMTDEQFDQIYSSPTYQTSPSGKRTTWSEDRDGKVIVFTGDAEGKNEKQILSGEYSRYGWFTDDYLLLRKGGGEMFIMEASGGNPIKVSDFHSSSAELYGHNFGHRRSHH